MEIATILQYDAIVLYNEGLEMINEFSTLLDDDIKELFNDTREVVQFMTDSYYLQLIVK